MISWKELLHDLDELLQTQTDPGALPEAAIRLIAATRANETGLLHDSGEQLSPLKDGLFLQPPLQLTEIDLLQQQQLTYLTDQFLEEFLEPNWLRTDHLLTWRSEFTRPKYNSQCVPWPETLSEQLQLYFCAILLDAATCDPQISDAALAAGFEFAKTKGLVAPLRDVVAAELKLGKRARERIEQDALSLIQAAAGGATK